MDPLPKIKLSGDYVDLVPLSFDHADALAEAASVSRETFKLTSVPSDLESSKVYIQRALDLYQNRAALPFATIEKKSGKIVGSTRFMNIEFWDCPKGHQFFRPSTIPHVVEIGATWISEPFQRTGINTDAKLQMLTYAFEEWKVLKVSFKTDARNSRSRTNIERVGAKFEGIVRAQMPSFDGGIRDTAFYSIVQIEWPEAKKRLQAKLR